jgi:hypothetical protein
MPHSGDDETSRRGRYRARTRSSGENGAVPNFSVRQGDGQVEAAMEGTVVGGDRDEPYAGRTTRRLTGGAGLPAGVRARESGGESGWRVGSARQREREIAQGRLARTRKQAGNGPRGGSRGREGGRSGRGMGWIKPSQGGEGFSFYFYFIITIYNFISLFF